LTHGEHFEQLIALMARLRAPGGCPWDREQTFDSIKPYTLEETYEVLAAISERDWAGLQDELGDLLLQILFYSEMATEAGYFGMQDVLQGLADKLIRRHPHVFGDAQAADSGQVLKNWEAIKAQERGQPSQAAPVSRLKEVSRKMPAVGEAYKLGARAAQDGFDWPDAEGVLAKLEEEIAEVRAELADAPPDHLDEEIGDLLFTVINLARRFEIEPETALKRANGKFRRRFAAMEERVQSAGSDVAQTSAADLDDHWRAVKRGEAKR